eukprot:TRINITY_DN71183_c0_g1_i1.p1 TRINITY_DN71183_c0_g1~~TRINITY_DN71183_c0_g1_i1.p1  ORF type:complete len:419 (-),score=87.65 TRINITY_DN71183_c0_g1_i1:53-1174(-)
MYGSASADVSPPLRAESLSVGLQRVGADFCRGRCGRLPGASSAAAAARPISVRILLPAPGEDGEAIVSFQWEMPVRIDPVLLATARVDVAARSIEDVSFEAFGDERTCAKLRLSKPPDLAIGTRAWAVPTGRRITSKRGGKMAWLGDPTHGGAALPPLLRNALVKTEELEVMMGHGITLVQDAFRHARAWAPAAAAADAEDAADAESPPPSQELVVAPTPVRCRRPPVDTPEEKQPRPARASSTGQGEEALRALAVEPAGAEAKPPASLPEASDAAAAAFSPVSRRAPAAACSPLQPEAGGKDFGSGGEQCDWCGLVPDEGRDALKICGRCRYSVCDECAPHQTKGTCFCKDSNFGQAYPRGAKRKSFMRGSW